MECRPAGNALIHCGNATQSRSSIPFQQQRNAKGLINRNCLFMKQGETFPFEQRS